MAAIGKCGEQRSEASFYKGKEGVGKGDFEQKSIGDEQEFRVVMTSLG